VVAYRGFQKAADHGRRATLAAPAVDVNDSAGGDLVSDAREDPVVAISVNDAFVRNGMSEVMDFPSGALRRELQCLPIRVEVISTHHACRVSSCRHSAFSPLEALRDRSIRLMDAAMTDKADIQPRMLDDPDRARK
jgi:hypothetical protein